VKKWDVLKGFHDENIPSTHSRFSSKKFFIMTRKMVFGAGAATLALLASFSCAKEKMVKPNVILIVVDDQGYGDLSCYPHTRPVDTPHIDQIASEGVLFTNGYANHHGSAPSRAALLTGRYQQRIGFYDIWEVQKGLPAGQKLLGDWLRQAGYATALIGKWHLGEKDYNHPLKMGFDRFFGFLGGMHDYYDPFIGDTWEGGANGYAPIYDQHNIVNSIDYLTNEFTRQAIRFIDQNRSGPFFIYLSYNAPHGPFQAPQVYLDKYPDESGTYRKIRAMTRVLDEDIGKIMSHLQKRKIDRNTLVVYVSDNGGTRAHHNWVLRGHKGMVTEGGIRVPFIMKLPGTIPGGLVYDQPAIFLDIMPTILDLAGIDEPAAAALDGVNLIPYLTGKASGSPHEVLHWSWDPYFDRWAIREGPWKALREMEDGKLITGLFRLDADPGEQINLIDQYPGKFEELRKIHLNWIDQMPPSLVGPDEWTPNGNGWYYYYDEHTGERVPLQTTNTQKILTD
jgi:arylsulfatase A-like enzyme